MNIYVYCRLRNCYSFLLCISRHVSAHMSHHRLRLGFCKCYGIRYVNGSVVYDRMSRVAKDAYTRGKIYVLL
jgi:hypothetical protein